MTKIENNAVTLEALLAFSLVQADPLNRAFHREGHYHAAGISRVELSGLKLSKQSSFSAICK